jgi:hypothetical protein
LKPGMELDVEWLCRWGADGGLVGVSTVKATACVGDSPKPWFVDQTALLLAQCPDAREQLEHGSAHWQLRMPAWAGFFRFGHHGGSLADVNGDGLVDLYVCQDAGLPNRLFLHKPDHTLEDVSAAWGLDILDATQAALFVDWDKDGDADATIATSGPLVFFENTGEKFESRLRLPQVSNVFALAASDYDNDGDLDLYAGRYFPKAEEGGALAVPTPAFAAENGGANFLVKNDGRSERWVAFSDATEASGLGQNNHRFTYAAVWDDFDNNGQPDLYVANDYGLNNLYLQRDGRFTDNAVAAGLGSGAFGMSASTADVNGDGLPDIHLGAMWSSAGNRVTTQDRFPQAEREAFQRMAQGNRLFLNN